MKYFLFLLASFILLHVHAQSSFRVIPLGVKGGGEENNLSAYLLSPFHSDDFICMDAGTVRAGLEMAYKTGALKIKPENTLRSGIKAFLISHGHLDHIAGMIINSPDDSVKNIYVMPYVADILKSKYFSWESWANFTDAGEKPALGKYRYKILDTAREIPVENTELSVRAFVLSHSEPYKSTAFLIRYGENYVLYLGDTGADTVEHTRRLFELWKAIAPLIDEKKLKGIFIEVSFPDKQPEKQLFGHLTPGLLMQEMKKLSDLCKEAKALVNLPVIITHIKPVADNERIIREELVKNNFLKLKIIFPEQGKAIFL
ncbi:MAG: 3',5'-cyclic-nucleotide phosphodiesterase [Chitinophagaceae bacterium]|jgi:3',5'-cyclic-nucleotide phosphodiesterase|nr:3',5'-cyclic-nucleotide phosphodiesterase [Chitinophagaceae bacterium]